MWKPWAAGDNAAELISPLSADECMRRLQAAMDSPWTVFGRRPVLGRAGARAFSARKRLRFGNSLQTYVRGAIEPAGPQTRIRCRFGIHPLAQAFLAIWFGLIVVLECGMVMLAVFVMRSEATQTKSVSGEGMITGSASVGMWLALIVPLLMVVLAYVLVRFGRWLARGERQYLTSFLCTTLQARAASGAAVKALTPRI